jgi:hypothetical protein
MEKLPTPNVFIGFLDAENATHDLFPVVLLKLQLQLVGIFVEVSVNSTVSSDFPEVALGVNEATGAGLAGVNDGTGGPDADTPATNRPHTAITPRTCI